MLILNDSWFQRPLQRMVYWGRRLSHHSRVLLRRPPWEQPKYLLEKAGVVKTLLSPDPLVRRANHQASRH